MNEIYYFSPSQFRRIVHLPNCKVVPNSVGWDIICSKETFKQIEKILEDE